ncbi:hypothetical protein [Buttiauxella brennerae]|uniref:hypothetical protein n=1 Tax=Buttiauxella brennerae TaxID=82988 RepID=UPI00286EC50B|nr:hypothetical protein [Buttiauxella brennerae]
MNTIRKIFHKRPTKEANPTLAIEAAKVYFQQFAAIATDEQLDRVAVLYSRLVRNADDAFFSRWGEALSVMALRADCEVSARFIIEN